MGRSALLSAGVAKRVAVVVAVVASATVVACHRDGPDSVDAFVAAQVPEGSSGSLAAAVGGDAVVCRGWGMADRERRTAAGCDTVYDVMSMTKQFTAAAVLTLQMQHELWTSDPISRHLRGVPADKQAITIHHLLTHTAGLVDTLGGDDERVSRAALLAAALDSDLRTEPGVAYHYSNVGYSLLAAIIEVVSGQGYEEYLAEHLFEPASMTRTGYVLPDWDRSQLAVEYDAAGVAQGRPTDRPWASDGPYWNLHGNGGLLSTPRDLLRWHRALEGDAVLDAEAKSQLVEPRVREEPGGDTWYAYGWVAQDVDGLDVLWHNGGNGRAYGELWRIPERDVMVFWVTNQARGSSWDFEELGPELSQGVIERLRRGA